MMTNDARRRFAADVVARLRESGHEAYWAGGCVRDLLLGLEPADYDVATDARPERVARLFRRTIGVGASFGVVKVLGPREAGDVEVATFRGDGDYLDGRRPESVTFTTAERDASRRDFTINGMFLDPADDRVIDFVGGRADLERRVLRAIGDPPARFAEDKLRLLRAVRFAARFGLAIEPATRAAIGAMAHRATDVSAERIAQELRRMLVHPSRAGAMRLAHDLGLVAAVLPPLDALKGFGDADVGGLWDHTLRLLDHLPESPGFPLAFAALLHDAGGPAVQGPPEETPHPNPPLQGGRGSDDRPTSSSPSPLVGEGGVGGGPRPGVVPRFAKTGRDVALELAASLKLSNAERDRIARLIEHRRSLVAPETLRPSRLKRLLASEGVADLLALHRAEALATGGDLAHVAYCERYLRECPDGPIDPATLLTGNDLIGHGLKPGPRFASLLERVRDAQLDGEIASRDEALALVDRLSATDTDEPR